MTPMYIGGAAYVSFVWYFFHSRTIGVQSFLRVMAYSAVADRVPSFFKVHGCYPCYAYNHQL